ncbi:hypothetical protein LXA43DRAFT_974611 [Ganoderma leucocontextum]|nr:hypothetical protein LXA43DRAFT_974611 [Ganoderma leucocontextum]
MAQGRYLDSTRNTRIERMWVEVGTQFAYRWRAFFTRLERRHQLDPSDPTHLWLLHFVFLDALNGDCDDFRNQWNHHPISGKGHDQSPLDIRLLGQLKQGQIHDDFEGVHPSILEEYYGVDRTERHPLRGRTGAGHSDTESEHGSEDEARSHIDSKIAASQDHHIRHDAIPTPTSECPFTTPELLATFKAAFQEVNASGIIPMCYGLLEAEWSLDGYGQRGRRVAVELPFSVWWPRAVAWSQGLDLMNRLLYVQDNCNT